MEIRNENLQSEIKNKSQQLSNVAINVVRKNEILQEIRDELQQVKAGNRPAITQYSLSKIAS